MQRQREERAMIARSAEEMRQRCIALERDLEEARRREEEGRRRLEESERRRAELEAMVGGASAGRGIQGQGAMGPVNG